jgi:hypothetical protein
VLELWRLIAMQLNVNAVICRGFSCRRLDETEEWLDVDFQISCLGDSYLAFVSLGMIGVFVYPLGIPTLSLLQLLRNAGDIKAGGPARERYEFLVGDYTPDYCECLVVMSMISSAAVLVFSSDLLMSRVHNIMGV